MTPYREPTAVEVYVKPSLTPKQKALIAWQVSSPGVIWFAKTLGKIMGVCCGGTVIVYCLGLLGSFLYGEPATTNNVIGWGLTGVGIVLCTYIPCKSVADHLKDHIHNIKRAIANEQDKLESK